MKNLKKNNKGFTLIELLAVIVILGVLMIIAIPMVTQYIASARKSAFVDTAKAYVSSARYAYLNGDYTCGTNIDGGNGGQLYILFKDIAVDKTGGNSSFGKEIDENKSYVVIDSDENGRYTYYVRMIDKGNNGWDEAINEDVLKKQNVSSNAKADAQIGSYIKITKNAQGQESTETKTTTNLCSKQ